MRSAETDKPEWPDTGESDDQRGSPRRRVLKAGKIVYNDGYSVLDVSLQDISETGARIRLLTPAVLPDTFHLYLGDGRKLRVEVMWRNAATLGVRFTDRPPDVAQPAICWAQPSLLDRISAIEQQLAELRRELIAGPRD